MTKYFSNTKLMLATPRGFCAGVERAVDIVNKAVDVASTEGDLNKITDIVENSKGTLANKTIDSANKSEENKKKITDIIVKIIEKNPEKAVEIIQNNQDTNKALDTIKSKIENNEAITSEDFEDVFENNVSPN